MTGLRGARAGQETTGGMRPVSGDAGSLRTALSVAHLPVRREVRQVAASLPKAARCGDQAEITRLLSAIRNDRDRDALVLLLARCADWGRLNAETGFIAAATPADYHAWFVRLRNRGVAAEDIGEHIRAGEREYQRLRKQHQRRGRDQRAA